MSLTSKHCLNDIYTILVYINRKYNLIYLTIELSSKNTKLNTSVLLDVNVSLYIIPI